MKKYMTILGISLIIPILISGSTVAPWAQSIYYPWSYDYTNESDALGAPDGDHATVGVNGPPQKLGRLALNLGSGNTMGPNTDFWINASSTINETYEVGLVDSSQNWYTPGWTGWDTEDCKFTTPPTGGNWQYIIITGKTGVVTDSDPIYGPEVDAAGF